MTSTVTYWVRRHFGLCTQCGEPAVEGKTRCAACLHDGVLASYRRRAAAWSRPTMCGECGRAAMAVYADGERFPLCQVCYLKRLAYTHLGSRRHWRALERKLEDQEFRCYYSGEKLVLGVNDSVDHRTPVSRVPEARFELNNLDWVTRTVNGMKGALTYTEFLALVRRIYEYRQGLTRR